MSRPVRLVPALFVGLAAVALAGCADGNVLDLARGPGGICGLLVLIADLWAFVQIANSRAETGSKVLWALLVFFFPVGGLVLWYFFGPKS